LTPRLVRPPYPTEKGAISRMASKPTYILLRQMGGLAAHVTQEKVCLWAEKKNHLTTTLSTDIPPSIATARTM